MMMKQLRQKPIGEKSIVLPVYLVERDSVCPPSAG